jgi:hypothetical protein
MKIRYTFLVTILLTVSSFLPQQASAQAPEKMSYQAIVRDSGGNLVANQLVGMQISILEGSAAGASVYTETQTPTTNVNGLVSLEIGTGTVVSGDFTTIDWGADTYFIKTETDPTGGASYTITGTSQLLSVPYALHAKTVSSITETDPSVPVGTTAGEMQYWNGTSWVLVTTSIIEGAALQLIGGIPTWVGGTPPPTVPDAPTIGTAVAGNGLASVPFTAPLDDGDSPITGYTATSSPGGFIGTLPQAGSGTIVVSGLTNGTAYTFSVTATNAIGTSTSSASSNSVIPTAAVAIGDLREGGIVFWVDPTDNTKGKVCALADAPTRLRWAGAIDYCFGYTNPDTGTGVYSNWYLPSKDELQLMYINKAAINTTAVANGADIFEEFYYWSSTEFDSDRAWRQNFSNGNQYDYSKNFTNYVRAVRAF